MVKIHEQSPKISWFLLVTWSFFFICVGLWPCFRARSSSYSQQFASHHPQVGQRKQREELGRVLLQGAVAHLDKSEPAFDNPKRTFHLGPDTHLELFRLPDQAIDFVFFVQRTRLGIGAPSLVRHWARVVAVQGGTGCSLRSCPALNFKLQ